MSNIKKAWRSYLPAKFETAQQATQQKLAVIQALSRQGNEKGAIASTIADCLQECCTARRCGSEACPECRRRYRLELIKECWNNDFTKGVWTRVSLIPSGLLFKEGELHEADLKGILARLRKNVERSNLSKAVIVGGIDISFNTFANAVDGWQLQLYVLINRPKTGQLEADIRATFSKGAERSFAIKEVGPDDTDLISALTYSYKNIFDRRSSYLETDRKKADGTPRINGRDLPLKAGQLSELSCWLGQYPVGSRLFLRNVKRPRVQAGRLKLEVGDDLYRRKSVVTK